VRIKAISLHNGWRAPWAEWIADGRKTIETRTWATRHRGRLLICASRLPHGDHDGQAVCVVDLVECREMEPADAAAAMTPWHINLYAWVLANARRVKPFPVQGHQRLFNVSLFEDEARDAGLVSALPSVPSVPSVVDPELGGSP